MPKARFGKETDGCSSDAKCREPCAARPDLRVGGLAHPEFYIIDDTELKLLGLLSSLLLSLFFVVHITLTDPLRIQPWSQVRRN